MPVFFQNLYHFLQMKNINSKSFKQYQNSNSNKRSISPLLGSTNQHIPQHSNSNPKSAKKKIITNSPYQKNIKQFDTYGKGEKKRISNYLQSQIAQHNKFRIVTQPVEDRVMHLAQSNIFNSSLAIKNKKVQTQAAQPSHQIRLNLRQNSHSKSRQKIYTTKNMNNYGGETQQYGQRYEQIQRSRDSTNVTKCKNCAKFAEQLQFLNIHIKKIIKTKQLWKGGEITYQQALEVFKNRNDQINSYHDIKDHNTVGKNIQKESGLSNKSPYSHNSLQNLQKNITLELHSTNPHQNIFKFADNIVNQIKFTISNLISQIQSLTSIDYPKMLQMQIFKYQPSYSDYIDNHEAELKELFGQLRMGIQGKIVDYDTYDTQSQNNYVKKIMRNLKSRLSYSLRENLQLRICKAIYQKSQQISEQSQEYLRKVIEEVIENYIQKPKFNHREKQRQKQKEKQKQKQKQKGKIVKRS